MQSIEKIIKNLVEYKDLSITQSKELFNLMIDGKIDPNLISCILTLFNYKGESYEEIFGAIKVLKERSKKIELSGDIIDTCGTGGDNKKSFNFSTATAILCSACGLKVAKHGNRAVTSKSGSMDILELLGININLSIEKQKIYFEDVGICFLNAPNFHSSLKSVAPIRKLLPFKTIFNLLGPLLNPSRLKYQLLGVGNKKNLDTHAKCLSKMNLKSSWVVHNMDGYDELTTTSPNIVVKVEKNKISNKIKITPEQAGLKYTNEKDLRGGSPKENAFILHRLFDGETSAIRENVLLNTSACLVMQKKVKNLKDGVLMASKFIDNFCAKKKLNEIISKSNKL